MSGLPQLSRRKFLAASGVIASGAVHGAFMPQNEEVSQSRMEIPLKIGHRAASMNMIGDFGVFKVARQIPDLSGVELQVAAGHPNLRDPDAIRQYKKQANRWGMMIPSLAGLWNAGSSIKSPVAGLDLFQAIRAGELLGASVLLAAFFDKSAPNMNDESSYGPLVELLQRGAPLAADMGITLGLENSLSPADNLRLLNLVDHPSVKVYYDVANFVSFGFADQAISGIALLGKERICQVHVKNEARLISEPGLIDWTDAFRAFNNIGYEGWYIFESEHNSRSQMIEATKKNIGFMKEHCRMPTG
jgi:L-ribulose-5-phosphate 3-epimerase